jgi:uncharacterized Zn finger protein
MTLSERLDARFDPASQRKGQGLFLSRAVRLNEGSPRHFHGEVQGTRYYQVNIDFDGRTVLLGCECPFFASTGPCKHLWAAILEAEKRGLLSEVVKAPSVEVEEDLEDDSELLDDSFVEWRPQPPVVKRLPMWQDHLATIQRNLPAHSADPRETEIGDGRARG